MEIKKENLYFVPLTEIRRIRKQISDPFLLCEILSDVFRLNVLYMIARAGSGHIGTSFSSMDVATWLWVQEMISPNEKKSSPSDIYFSSKGHDVPALYSLLIGLEKLDFNLIHRLRRLGGLPGHPDIGTPYIATNTGSLGMGISKARGMAIGRRLSGKRGRIYVMTGDGELQEGQIWESLQPIANEKLSEITVIVDCNKMQSNNWVRNISNLGKLENKFRAFGWEVIRCDGHDFKALKKVFAHFKTIKDKPKVLIADTIKGKGVSFMESLSFGPNEEYRFHAGAPSSEDYFLALTEMLTRVNKKLIKNSPSSLRLETVARPDRTIFPKVERLIDAYEKELVKIGQKRKDIVVLDADLLPDCGIGQFKKKFPDRFFECGIAEQDMVSVAGGLALQGRLPIAHSFACFISTRPNEQIYNNASEHEKIIYVGTLAGLLPATPGHSHQSVRDISALAAVPGLVLLQPGNEQETRMALQWAVKINKQSTYLRFVSIQCEKLFKLPRSYRLKMGRGVVLKPGADSAIIAYGPLMLGEAIKAAQLLSTKNVSLAVINLPWLNRLDEKWLLKAVKKYKTLFTLDDHYVEFGQGMMIAGALARSFGSYPKVVSLGVRELPESGHNTEVLKYHGLDFESLSKKIEKNI